MPLILAIEPNKTQAQQIASLVKHHLRGAELVSAADAEGALRALGERVPDLVLTPALLAPRDEAALTDHLRQLGAAGAHIHTLAVPIIATTKSAVAKVSGGLLGRRRERSDGDSAVGCEPSVFAEQIKVYLDRAARERDATGEPPDAPEPVEAHAEETGDSDFSEIEWLPDEPAIATEPPPAAPVEPREPEPVNAARPEPPVQVIESARTPPVQVEPPVQPRVVNPATRAFEAEFGLPSATGGAPLWRVAEVGIEALTPEPEPVVEPLRPILVEPAAIVAEPAAAVAESSQAPAAPMVAATEEEAPEPPAAKAAVKPAKSRKQPPAMEEWARFDPYQAPFKALVRRLDEIAGAV